MKYQIDTIPVLNAFEQDSECPLCLLKKKAEESGLKYYLGHSVMVPEVRIKLNETGFCSKHFTALLNAEESRLGLALMTHTRMLKLIEEMKKDIAPGVSSPGKLVKKGKSWSEKTRENEKVCPLCAEVEKTLLRYAATVAWLWDNESDFLEILKNSKGFCLTHLPLILGTGPAMLSGKKYRDYYSDIYTLQIKELERTAEDIEWYTKKFDTTNKDAPWKNSKDALPRAIRKLIGI